MTLTGRIWDKLSITVRTTDGKVLHGTATHVGSFPEENHADRLGGGRAAALGEDGLRKTNGWALDLSAKDGQGAG